MNGVTEDRVKNGFRRSGIYPWTAEAVDFSKCLANNKSEEIVTKPRSVVPKSRSAEKLNLLSYIEKFIQPEILQLFKSTETDEWLGAERDFAFFHVWKNIKGDLTRHHKNDNVPEVSERT